MLQTGRGQLDPAGQAAREGEQAAIVIKVADQAVRLSPGDGKSSRADQAVQVVMAGRFIERQLPGPAVEAESAVRRPVGRQQDRQAENDRRSHQGGKIRRCAQDLPALAGQSDHIGPEGRQNVRFPVARAQVDQVVK